MYSPASIKELNLTSHLGYSYSPHVLAATFVGVRSLFAAKAALAEPCLLQHIHDEALYLTYANNGTVKDSTTALGATWVGPSITPLTNLNSGEHLSRAHTCCVLSTDLPRC